MRLAIFTLCLLLLSGTPAGAQVSIGIAIPGLSIGINMPVYPTLVRVPGYPVYYAPGVRANYFFYDGVYWIFQGDSWYASSWYNGPWTLASPEAIPLFILRVPVRYYREPPVYFRGWRADAPPRWGEHWGPQWERNRHGWDQWDHRAVPAPAPLPSYQREYSGKRYPGPEEQHVLRAEKYRYVPRDAVGRQIFQEPSGRGRPRTSGTLPETAPQREGRPLQGSPGVGGVDRGQQTRGQNAPQGRQAPPPVRQGGVAAPPTPQAPPDSSRSQRQRQAPDAGRAPGSQGERSRGNQGNDRGTRGQGGRESDQ